MHAQQKKKWLFSELTKLRELAPTHTTEELMKEFPGRTRKSIERQIEQLRSKNKVDYREEQTRERAYRERSSQ
jgi:SOS-response transcriptional repressor LexA